MAGTDDGNRQVALTVDQIAVSLGLNVEQFDKLVELGVQQDANLDGINGAINKLAENVSDPDTSVAAEISLLRNELGIRLTTLDQAVVLLSQSITFMNENLAKWLAAIALAASTPDDNSAAVQAKINELTQNLRTSTDAVEEAINQDKSKG